jgi:hypothetical protein
LKRNKIIKSKLIISLFIVLILVLSSSISTFVTGVGGNVNAAYAAIRSDSSGGSDDGGGGDNDDDKKDKKSSKDSSAGGGDGSSSSPSSDSSSAAPPSNADTNNDNNPPASAADNTATGGEQNQQQQQQQALQGTLTLAPPKRLCPEGQSFDTSTRKCLSNPPPTEPTPEATIPQAPTGGSTTAQLNSLPSTTLTPTSPKTPCPEGMIFDPKIGHCLPISDTKTQHIIYQCLLYIFCGNLLPENDEEQDPGLPPCSDTNPCGAPISAGCPTGQHYDGKTCVDNRFPFPSGDCVAGYHLDATRTKCLPDTHVSKFAKAPDRFPNSLQKQTGPVSKTLTEVPDHPTLSSLQKQTGGGASTGPTQTTTPTPTATPSTTNPAIKTELQSPDGAVPKLGGCPEGKHYDSNYKGCLSNISPLPNGKCVQGYHRVSTGTCEKDAIAQPNALGTCPTGFHLSKGLCYIDEIPDDDGKCVQGSHLVKNPKKNPALSCVKDGATLNPNDDRSCALGYHLITLGPPSNDPDPSLLCVEDKNTQSTQQSPIKQPNNVAGGGGSAVTTQTTTPTATPPSKQTGETKPIGGSTTTTTTTPSPSPTTTTTVVNNNNRGSPSTSSSGGGSSSSGSAGGTTQTSINFLTYVNAPNKITIKYPDTWTKTESLDDSRIPVMFNAPIADSTAGAAKTSFMIMINKLNSPTPTLDDYTQQQIDGLTHSKTVKYTITDTNAKALTPPNGVSAFREVSYDGLKSNNDVVATSGGGSNSQASIPLKGTAIFFVNGDTGYSLLYLAKQIDYDSSLPIIQQMIKSFQIGAGSSSSSANSSGGDVQSVVSTSGQK